MVVMGGANSKQASVVPSRFASEQHPAREGSSMRRLRPQFMPQTVDCGRGFAASQVGERKHPGSSRARKLGRFLDSVYVKASRGTLARLGPIDYSR
jgi:hypothetical protein